MTVSVLSISATEPEPDRIDRAAGVLRAGGVVLFPTDTLYGIAVDPRQEDAVRRLFEVKGRVEAAAIPLVAATVEQADAAGVLGPREQTLARAFWPGPLTVVVPARPGLAPAVLAGGRTVAVRVPAHRVARALAASLGFCVTATSANRSGQPPVAHPAELDADLCARADLILDAGATPGIAPSTIVELTQAGPRLVRPGAIAWDRVLESLQ
ncbi:MAG TPA: L-threonylcarbamoyladenylate synthase [Vicinamibacterales bacterium]|nr:L-threonylcarbamoyladenylate synthase [Vicinamibacterales bacterium]